MKALRLPERPFYAARLGAAGQPRPWSLEDLEDFVSEHDDPFGGRLLPGDRPALALELEACDAPAVWVGASGGELRAWSGALEALFRRCGVEAGECVALFDYGSSPLVLLAAGSYAPHLRRGVAERLGLRVVCNDGVASLADRMVDIVTRIRPSLWVLRRDVLAPLDEVLQTAGVDPGEACRAVIVTQAEGMPPAPELARFAASWGVAFRRTWRADAAFFLAGDCPRCEAFHVDPRLYAIEPVEDGGVAVTTRFARACPAVRHRLEGAVWLAPGCPEEPRSPRIAWA